MPQRAEHDHPNDVPDGMHWPTPESVLEEGQRQLRVAEEQRISEIIRQQAGEKEVSTAYYTPHHEVIKEVVKEIPVFEGIPIRGALGYPRLQTDVKKDDGRVVAQTFVLPWGVRVKNGSNITDIANKDLQETTLVADTLREVLR